MTERLSRPHIDGESWSYVARNGRVAVELIVRRSAETGLLVLHDAVVHRRIAGIVGEEPECLLVGGRCDMTGIHLAAGPVFDEFAVKQSLLWAQPEAFWIALGGICIAYEQPRPLVAGYYEEF